MSDSDDEYGPPLPPGFSQNMSSKPVEKKKSIGPALPPSFVNKSSSSRKTYSSDSGHSSDSESDTVGPALPPSFKSSKDKRSENEGQCKSQGHSIIGPMLPPHLQAKLAANNDSGSDSDSEKTKSRSRFIGPSVPGQSVPVIDSDDDCSAYIGPLPAEAGKEGNTMTAAEEFENRARKMKDKLEGKEEVKAPQRESWMMELPEAIGKDFGLVNRNFRKTAAPTGDRSGWTDTPADKERKERERHKRKNETDEGHDGPSQKDIKVRDAIEKYNEKHRPESLLEKHQKKRKKEKKKEKNKDKPEERRPFDREVDLQVNRMDDAKRRAIIKRSQDLHGRFKSGGMGTSFM